MEKILIVEDEIELALNIKEIIESFGYQVSGIHPEGQSVLTFLKTSKVDLILMDIQIKGEMDGIDLCYTIKELYDVPIIFLTAYSDQSYLDRISNVIYDGYLLKPFKIESLKTAVYLALKAKPYAVPYKDLDKLTLKVRDKGYVVPIPLSDILYLKADGLYTKIFTPIKSYVVRDILKDLQAKLPENLFIRPHKSFVVNINKIISFNSKELVVKDAIIPIRRGFFKILSDIKN